MHNDLDVTVVYVTHDQEEALTLSTKVAVMNNGVIEQYDAPSQVYKNPASLFVADFMGNPQMNFLKVTSSVRTEALSCVLPQEKACKCKSPSSLDRFFLVYGQKICASAQSRFLRG